jgi:hypothetical protein
MELLLVGLVEKALATPRRRQVSEVLREERHGSLGNPDEKRRTRSTTASLYWHIRIVMVKEHAQAFLIRLHGGDAYAPSGSYMYPNRKGNQ